MAKSSGIFSAITLHICCNRWPVQCHKYCRCRPFCPRDRARARFVCCCGPLCDWLQCVCVCVRSVTAECNLLELCAKIIYVYVVCVCMHRGYAIIVVHHICMSRGAARSRFHGGQGDTQNISIHRVVTRNAHGQHTHTHEHTGAGAGTVAAAATAAVARRRRRRRVGILIVNRR